jgi:hypothetical protein
LPPLSQSCLTLRSRVLPLSADKKNLALGLKLEDDQVQRVTNLCFFGALSENGFLVFRPENWSLLIQLVALACKVMKNSIYHSLEGSVICFTTREVVSIHGYVDCVSKAWAGLAWSNVRRVRSWSSRRRTLSKSLAVERIFLGTLFGTCRVRGDAILVFFGTSSPSMCGHCGYHEPHWQRGHRSRQVYYGASQDIDWVTCPDTTSCCTFTRPPYLSTMTAFYEGVVQSELPTRHQLWESSYGADRCNM